MFFDQIARFQLRRPDTSLSHVMVSILQCKCTSS